MLFQLIQSLKLGMQGAFSKLAIKLLFFSKLVAFLCTKLLEIVSNNICLTCSVLNISEVRLKVSMAMSPSQRPRGVLGFWASLMTALGNTENMPVSVTILLLMSLGFMVSQNFLA